MSHSRYFIIIAVMALGAGLLLLAQGKSVSIAVNPSSLLADAGEWDDSATQQADPRPDQWGYFGGDNSGSSYSFPSTIDSPQNSQTVVNWGDYFTLQTLDTQRLIDNQSIWTGGGDTNVSAPISAEPAIDSSKIIQYALPSWFSPIPQGVGALPFGEERQSAEAQIITAYEGNQDILNQKRGSDSSVSYVAESNPQWARISFIDQANDVVKSVLPDGVSVASFGLQGVELKKVDKSQESFSLLLGPKKVEARWTVWSIFGR